MDEAAVRAAVDALTVGPLLTPAEALDAVPRTPGLYAIHGDLSACGDLATGTPEGPLYVGKAERSLAARDVRTHFATGRTGSSTLRRTLAALLRERLDLRAIPRNLAARVPAPTTRWSRTVMCG